MAYVANFDGSTVSVIDTKSKEVTGTITGFSDASDIVLSPDGLIAYVTNYGDGTVSIVDTTTFVILDDITVGFRPNGLTISPLGDFLYVANLNGGVVSVVNTQTKVEDQQLNVTGFPFKIQVTPNGLKAYVTHLFPNGLAVLSTQPHPISEIKNISVGVTPADVAISADGTRVYVTNLISQSVSIVDTSIDEVIDTINVGANANGVAVTADGEFLYVTLANDTTEVYKLPEKTFIKSIGVGSAPRYPSILSVMEELTVNGSSEKNVFFTEIELFNLITWSPPEKGTPLFYKIYRDEEFTNLIGIVPARDSLEFKDHNRVLNIPYTYYVVAEDDEGPFAQGRTTIRTRREKP